MLFLRIRHAFVSTVVLYFSIFTAHAIVSGTVASTGEFPWMAGIIKKGSFSSPALIGGGALISGQLVITAAHSIESESAETIEIWIGMTDLGVPSSRVVRNVLAIYRHPDFTISSGESEADLAILVLDQPIVGIPILPILEDIENLSAGDLLEVAGFGTTDSEILEPSQILLKADAQIITPSMAPFPHNLTPQDSRLAAIDPNVESSPCRGDSGGPLVKKLDGVDTLVGIVSFGSIDCDPGIPSVYTNVAFYSDWIQAVLALGIPAPRITVFGKGRPIANGDGSPRKGDGSEFGKSRSSVTRTFVIQNAGTGLLTVHAVEKTHRNFSIRTPPANFVAAGGSTSFRVTHKPRNRRGRSRAWVRIITSDPSAPLFVFRVEGRSKQKK